MARPREEVHTSPRNEFGAIGTGNSRLSGVWSLVQNGEPKDQVETLAHCLLLQEGGRVCRWPECAPQFTGLRTGPSLPSLRA